MSLILDALRKSEAERRRGQAPDLHAELPPAVQSARAGRPAWPWLLALAATAIVVALVMTWLARDPAAPASDTADAMPDSPPERLPARIAGSAPADIAEVRTSADPDDRGSVSAPEAAAAPPPAVATIAPARPVTAPSPRPEPIATPPRDGGDGRTLATQEPAAAPSAVKKPAAAPTPGTPSSASPPAPPVAVATPPIPAAPSTPTDVDKRAPLQLAALAATERRALPPLKISMHMWAPTPAGRFAIIDGARVNEGDRLGDAVVDEITRDGVILAWQGRRVRIPIH